MTAYVESPGTTAPHARLEHLPVTFFAVVMGLGGLSLAWTRAHTVLGAPAWVGVVLFWFALAVYALVALGYLAKLVRYPAAVRSEARHPVRLAFIPTITIALLILSTAGLTIVPSASAAMWWVGAVGQLALTLFVLSRWVGRADFALGHVTPAWFIPVVGLVIVPLAGVEHAQVEISWFFFSVGLVFWVALLPIVLQRLFVHDQPVPAKLLPTLAVLVAPPSVVFLSWLRLDGPGLDAFARITYYAALFFALLWATQVGVLRRIPFFLSWWAYSFPLAAFTTATIVMARESGYAAFTWLGWALLGGASALIAVLAGRTVAEMARGRICIPE
jgi:tellurite resistance protein